MLLLRHAFSLSPSHLPAPAHVPLHCPPQRQALLDAAKLAGLSVMGLVHSHAAAALQYGIERDFTNRTETVVLYDLGAASLQAALVSYSAYTDAKVSRASG